MSHKQPTLEHPFHCACPECLEANSRERIRTFIQDDKEIGFMTLRDIIRLVNTKFDSVDVLKLAYNHLLEGNTGLAKGEIRTYLERIGEWTE